MHLLPPTRVLERPPDLLDPEIIPLKPLDRVPVLRVLRPVRQAVPAELQVRRHPGAERRHQDGHVEDGGREKAGVLGGRDTEAEVGLGGEARELLAGQGEFDLGGGAVEGGENLEEDFDGEV